MPASQAFFFVVDLEATCDDAGRMPHHEMETIEIGAALVDAEQYEIVGTFQTFVRPVKHPLLTPFCTKLTTIRQQDVDAAPLFPEAIEAARRFLDGRDVMFCSWGAYDVKQLAQDAAYHGMKVPFIGSTMNVKTEFSARLGRTKRYGMAEALRIAHLPLVGTHHRGIDDAINIARLLKFTATGV